MGMISPRTGTSLDIPRTKKRMLPLQPVCRQEPHLMGMFSPRTGAPSMISNFASVSVSWCDVLPLPVNRRHFFFALLQVLKSKFFENSNLNA